MPSAVNINTDTQLVELEDGSIQLAYEGIRYSKDQFVPFHIFGVNSSPAGIRPRRNSLLAPCSPNSAKIMRNGPRWHSNFCFRKIRAKAYDEDRLPGGASQPNGRERQAVTRRLIAWRKLLFPPGSNRLTVEIRSPQRSDS